VDKLGTLTTAGKVQQYLAGREMGLRYWSSRRCLNKEDLDSEIYTLSSHKTRAQESLQWFFSGLEQQISCDSQTSKEFVELQHVAGELPPLSLSEATLHFYQNTRRIFKS